MKPFRDPGDWTQAALGKAIGKSDRQIRCWETESADAAGVPFQRIAETLGVPEHDLVQAHRNWLRACRVSQIGVDTRLIAESLQACQCTTLADDVLRRLNVSTVEEPANRLAGHIRDDNFPSIWSGCNQPIRSAVEAVLKAAKLPKDLERFRSFVGSVALSAEWLEGAKEGVNLGGQIVSGLSKAADLWDKVSGPFGSAGPGA